MKKLLLFFLLTLSSLSFGGDVPLSFSKSYAQIERMEQEAKNNKLKIVDKWQKNASNQFALRSSKPIDDIDGFKQALEELKVNEDENYMIGRIISDKDYFHADFLPRNSSSDELWVLGLSVKKGTSYIYYWSIW